ncbi:MAG: IS5 family transposase [Verrucomicrobia bacterium]|jgi:IS5 family transposase|nr:IS5 family transposase [Verrucomicrobiota bacterium]
MDQMSFADMEYQNKKRKTRREKFLDRIENLIPWERLEKKLKRSYPKGKTGRPPYPLGTMLRIHCMQLFYNLSDPAMKDALYEIESMRRFAGLRLSDRLPDETTILNFRHFLEQHNLGQEIFEEVNAHLQDHGLMLREGSIVDASIIDAPSSTKNQKGERDPEMHQTRKGNQWHFGMKMHIGVDDVLGLVHSIETTPANVHDLEAAPKLLHGSEERVLGDAGYRGMEKREEHKDRKVNWYIAERPGRRKSMEPGSEEAWIEEFKASMRAKVEHPFFWVKRIFGYNKVRYRGLTKNRNRLCVLTAFANLLIGEKYMLA